MKSKLVRFSAFLLIFVFSLAGCSPILIDIPQKKTIYTTFYPIYALAEMIVKDVENRQVHCLGQPQDDCLRVYTLSDWDLYMLNYSTDLLLAAGNGLESFDDQLEKLGETSFPVAEIMYGLQMQAFDDSVDEESHFSGESPHLYMSIDGAVSILENISSAMSIFDADNAETYEHNLLEAREIVENVRQYIEKETEVCSGLPCAVMHEALFYTAEDCNLTVVAWYERESGEMLYGDTLAQCIDRFKMSGVELILIEDQAPLALVDALEKSGFTVVKLDILSTHKESDGAEGYLNALKKNASLLAEACTKQ